MKSIASRWACSPCVIQRTCCPAARLACAASARATSVFPVPGGPWNNTPRGGVTPMRSNKSGYSSGSSTISLSEDKYASRPPTCVYMYVCVLRVHCYPWC